MTTEENVLFFLIRQAIAKSVEPCDIDGINWRNVYELSVQQGVCSIACDGLLQLNRCEIDENLRYKWIGQSMVQENKNAANVKAISHLAAAYLKKGIKMMLLKGYGLSLNYPIPMHRPLGDIDVYLFGDWKNGDELMRKGFGITIDNEHEHHTTFQFENQFVENHYDFINTKATRSAKQIEHELKLMAVSEECKIIVEGEIVYLPPPDFNAFFLMRHMGQHFASSSIKVRHVLDWGLFVERYRDVVDWGRIIDSWKKFGLYPFAKCIISICERWFAVKLDKVINHSDEPDEWMVSRVMNDILHPEFSQKKPDGLFPIVCYKTKRFFANVWKKELVYNDSIIEQFIIGSMAHIRRLSTISD